MKTINVAVIGAGAISRRAHLPAWKTFDNIEVAFIVDNNLELAEKVANEFNIPNVTDNLKDLNMDNIDIIDICTPTNTHRELAMWAINKNKHILMEKPLTLNLEEALEIFSKLKMKELKFCMIQNWRYLDSVLKVKERIKAGRLGNIETIQGNAFNHAPTGWTRNKWLYHKSAVLFDFTPHLVDAVLWLVGEKVKSVYALGKRFTSYVNFLGAAQIIIEFHNGTVALLDNSWRTNQSLFDIKIFGTGGTIDLNFKRDIFFEIHGGVGIVKEADILIKKYTNILKGIVKGDLTTKPNLSYNKIFTDFIQSIDIGSPIPMPIEEGVVVNLVLEAAKISIEKGRKIEITDLVENLKNYDEKVVSPFIK